ncbi:hypothetical protein BSKO_08482 [Bryopsis sp. KO-2023]|nr:hypothetical protein BSKO_08482 [Bryopsis sp. KO-2023]
MKRAATRSRTAPSANLSLEDLPKELLVLILSKVPSGDLLLRVSCASRRLALASEIVFQELCASRRWRPPRRPRGREAETKIFKWRRLYFTKACSISEQNISEQHNSTSIGPILM